MKSKVKLPKVKLPKEVFVHWGGDAPDQYLDARETTDGIDDGIKVGIYRLVEVKTQRITEELV